MSKEQKSLLLLVRFTVAIVTITLIVLAYTLIKSDQTAFGIVIAILALLILFGGSAFLSSLSKKINTGEVFQDELSLSRLYKASYITFNISILLWLALASFIDDFAEPRYAFYIGIFGMFLILFVTTFAQKYVGVD